MRRKPLAGALLVVAVAAVLAAVALWAPTHSTAPIVALEGETTASQGAAGAEVPTIVPETAADESVAESAGSAVSSASAVEVTAARTFAGTQLASNAGLTLSATARELLVGGQVDARSILSLGQYLGQTQLTVADFPASSATATGVGADEVRRQILVSGLAGMPVGTDASGPGGAATASSASDGAAASVEAWFRALSAPVDVESVVRTPSGVLVTFAPGEPSSMLPSPAPSL